MESVGITLQNITITHIQKVSRILNLDSSVCIFTKYILNSPVAFVLDNAIIKIRPDYLKFFLIYFDEPKNYSAIIILCDFMCQLLFRAHALISCIIYVFIIFMRSFTRITLRRPTHQNCKFQRHGRFLLRLD